MRPWDPDALRARLRAARLMLIFTPQLCRDPSSVLEEVLPWVDIVQVRPKPLPKSPAPAREVYDWCLRAIELTAARSAEAVPVIANDRVDVAAALWERGCAGVHLGQDDCPVAIARQNLGPLPLVGLSTHSMADVASATELDVDYLGFGPIHPTRT
jgi:thiamine-phosphate pyrophosphorylase